MVIKGLLFGIFCVTCWVSAVSLVVAALGIL